MTFILHVPSATQARLDAFDYNLEFIPYSMLDQLDQSLGLQNSHNTPYRHTGHTLRQHPILRPAAF